MIDRTGVRGPVVRPFLGSGGSVVFTTGSTDFEFAAVPEPSTWAMLGIGFAGLALSGYKRSRRDRLAPALG